MYFIVLKSDSINGLSLLILGLLKDGMTPRP
jgi:hypothetical protein